MAESDQEPQTVHQCTFVYYSPVSPQPVIGAVVSPGGLEDFKDGFWVNGKHEFTRADHDDAIQWVPPSQILRVIKINRPKVVKPKLVTKK